MKTKLTAHENPDGYSEGTWEYRIELIEEPGSLWFNGGYPSREHALEAGKAHQSWIEEGQ